jgi:ATP adenylyltransferase/5',5'''-P-1,P-4-tetraphosphate phosphorylase II
VKVVSKLPSILNITHRKNKVDWINQHEMQNENNSLTIDKIETHNNDKVHINKYNVVKEIEEISSHLSKPIQHISSTKFMYEFSFEYPMLP